VSHAVKHPVKLLVPCLLAALVGSASAADAPDRPVRVAVLVGANGAAPGRQPLLYSHRDVDRMAEVRRAVGGFDAANVFVLKDPSPKGLVGALTAAVTRLQDHPQSLLYFYYSGHADDQSLYPGGQPTPLAPLRALIDEARVAVKVGVVDACRGGSWTRAKGLVPDEPFAVRWPVSLGTEGSVLISSSSGLESAHESDRLQGSFFTYHFTGGLRGAADRNNNGEITMTEAFEYAKERTIRDTLKLAIETQHPSYAVNLRGRRDLVLAQVASSPSTLSLEQQEGPLELIHAESGLQLLELPAGARKVKLAVPPGTYLVRKRMRDGNLVREIRVTAGGRNELSEADLTLVGHTGLAAKSAAPAAPTPAHLDLDSPLSEQPAETRQWAKVGALVAGGVALASFAMAFKFAGDLNSINEELDPFRRFNCLDGTPNGCKDTAGTMKDLPLTPAQQDYVQQLQDEGKRYDRYQYVSLGLSAVALAASAPFFYFWLADKPSGGGETAVRYTPVLAPGQAGFTAQLLF
jgi:hypothetical protein